MVDPFDFNHDGKVSGSEEYIRYKVITDDNKNSNSGGKRSPNGSNNIGCAFLAFIVCGTIFGEILSGDLDLGTFGYILGIIFLIITIRSAIKMFNG